MTAPTEKTISSIFPRDELRQVPIARAANLMSYELDTVRMREDYSLTDAVETFVAQYSVAIPRHESAKKWADEIWVLIKADKVLDSERAQAERAARTTLAWRFPFGNVPMVGWIPGLTVSLPGGSFRLVGSACERCGVNPQAYGIGGGIRCVDTQNCGWWFCY